MGDITVVTVLNGCENQLMYHWGAPPCRMSNMNIWYVPSGDPTWILESANFLKQKVIHNFQVTGWKLAGLTKVWLENRLTPKFAGPFVIICAPCLGQTYLDFSQQQGIFLAAISAENLWCVDDFFIAPYWTSHVSYIFQRDALALSAAGCTVSPSAHQQWPFQSLPCPGGLVDESGITPKHQGVHVKTQQLVLMRMVKSGTLTKF